MIDTILQGDSYEMLKTIPDGTVNCCVTSPPYYSLRDYKMDGQIGLEKTPEEYIARLVKVFDEVKRVLKDDGTLWIVIGDSYVGSNKGGATHPENAEKYKQGTNNGGVTSKIVQPIPLGYKRKDLFGIPWMLAFALRADGWYLRQDIIWAKKNPMPESVTDRCTKSHEYIFLLSKIPGYYYDTEAIKESCAISSSWQPHNRECRYGGRKYTESPDEFYRTKSGNAYDFRERVNKRDVWRVSNAAFKEAHFAVFPPDLIKPCILAGCPTGGTVLDPFLGSGTTAAVALSLDRHFIGVELNPEYIEIAERRIHPLMAQIKMDLEVKTNGKSL